MEAFSEKLTFKKKQSDSDFIKSLPSQPGKEFEIKKRLDRLKGINSNDFKNNNNNNTGRNPGRTNLNLDNYGLNQPPPSLPNIEDFIDNGRPPPSPAPGGTNISFNNVPKPPPKTDFNVDETKNPFVLPTIWGNKGIGNNIFGSQAIMSGPREPVKNKTKQEIDDFLYEIPDKGMPTLELGGKLIETLGTEAEALFNSNAPPTKKEEEDEVLKNIIDEYNIDGMKNAMDETGQVPESIFFTGGGSQQFVDALKFIGLSPINREFAAFFLSDLGRQTMTQNKLSIHVESGDIFYDNHNTEENFYNFLLSQQNDEAAYVPKKFSYNNSFEKYITTFLQAFSIEDQGKFDLLAFKNSKYLFYRFNDFVKAFGNPRYKLLHTRKMLDSVGLKKVEDKNKQFLIEKIIHGVEFQNFYQSNPEKNAEIMETIESNYGVARIFIRQPEDCQHLIDS